MRDPYSVLGVSKNAKPQEIKSAFRKLAKQYHPDHNQSDTNAQAKFSEINQAYEIIGDKDKKARYDRGEIDAEGKPSFQSGHGFSGNRGFGQRNYGGRETFEFGGGNGGFDASDIFRDLFGSGFSSKGFSDKSYGNSGQAGGFSGFSNRSRQQSAAKGVDIKASLAVSLEQIAGGEKVEVFFPHGKKLNLKLPIYVEDGQVIRLKGQGESSPHNEAGDAYVTISLKKHARFTLDGRAVHLDLPISLKDAVFGTKAEVETLEGRIALTIPSWSNSDRILRLKGKGLPLKTGGRDDLYVHIRIMLPEGGEAVALEKFLKGK